MLWVHTYLFIYLHSHGWKIIVTSCAARVGEGEGERERDHEVENRENKGGQEGKCVPEEEEVGETNDFWLFCSVSSWFSLLTFCRLSSSSSTWQ